MILPILVSVLRRLTVDEELPLRFGQDQGIFLDQELREGLEEQVDGLVDYGAGGRIKPESGDGFDQNRDGVDRLFLDTLICHYCTCHDVGLAGGGRTISPRDAPIKQKRRIIST